MSEQETQPKGTQEPTEQETAEAEEQPKQRSRQKRFRKRKRDSEEEEDESDVMSRLEETKEYINTRERKHGVNMSANSVGYSTARRKRDDEVVGRLEDNFKASQIEIPEKQMDKRMEEYIEQQIRKRKEQGGGDLLPEPSQEPSRSSEQEAPASAASAAQPAAAGKDDPMKIMGERRVAGPKWGMGVVEVQLPDEYRLKNIEETKAMLKEIEGKQTRGLSSDIIVGANVSANYAEQIARRTRETNRPSDEAALERFKRQNAW